MFHQILKVSKCSSSSDVEATFVQLPNAIVFNCVAVSYYKKKESQP